MITLYRANETNFEHHGLGTLDKACKRASVEEELNGLYSLTLQYPLSAKHGKTIKNQMLIKAPTPSGPQLFRVYQCEPSMGMLTITCLHIFYDLAFNLVEDTNIVGKSAQGWLEQLSRSAQYSHPFTFFSDIPDVRGSRVVRKNLVEILLDNSLDQSFVSRFGGEIYRDNFTIHFKQTMGLNRNYKIVHKKNLIGYKAKIDDSTVVTRIMPVGFNGVLLPEKYVDSPRLSQYPFPRIDKVEFAEVKAAIGEYADDEDAIPVIDAYEKMRELSRALFGEIDTPESSYEVDFVELSKTKEYEQFAVLERVLLGDTVTVEHSEDGFEAIAKVVKYVFDALTERFERLELGSISQRSSYQQANQQRSVEQELATIKEQTNLIQVSANGKNTIYRGVERPVNANIGDLWYEPQGRSVVLKQWSGTDWEIIPVSDQNLGNVNINNLSGNAIDIKQFRLANGKDDILFINQQGEVVLNVKQIRISNQEVATKEDLKNLSLVSGKDGVGIESTTITYASSSSGTNAPSTGWGNTVPTVPPGQYLWTKTTWTYTDNTSETGFSVAKTGENGAKGDQGIPGTKGADGKTQYTHIAYADNATGGGFSQTDQSKAFIGMYQDFNATDSSNPAMYRWTKWKGSDGANGVPGAKGADGRTPYIHFAYADSQDGRTGFSTTQTDNKRYLGTYTDYTQADSTDPSKYKWVDMVGTVEIGGRNLLLNSNFEKVAKGNSFTVDGQVYDTTATNWTTYNGGVTNATTSYHAYVADFEGRKNAIIYNESDGSRNWKGIHQILDDRMPQTTNNFILSADVFVTGAGTKLFGGFYYIDKSGSYNFHSGRFQFDTSSFEIGKWQRVNVAVPFEKGKADFSRGVRFYIYAYNFTSNAILAIDDVQLETGNVAKDHSLAPEDIQSDIDAKADQVLTQEQLNALNEKAQILDAEMKAKASMEALGDLEKAYNAFIENNAKASAQAEKELIEAGRRIELLTTQFGGLAELKTFIDTYMKSTNEGLIIGKNDASSTFKVSSDRISMFSAGKEVMYISQGVIHIDNGIFTASVQIGKFRTEQYHLNPDMNVIRYVGG
ncbi:phage tail spike protein [Streptococcus cameli]